MQETLNDIGEYLLNQSWQVVVVFIAVGTVCWFLRNASAHWRYMLWLIVLLKCVFPPIVSLPLAVLPPEGVQQSVGSSTVEEIMPVATHDSLAESHSSADFTGVVVDYAPRSVSLVADLNEPRVLKDTSGTPLISNIHTSTWIVTIRVFGIVFCGFVVLLKARRLNARLKRSRRLANGELQLRIEELSAKVGLKRTPVVFVVDGIAQPFVWGWVKGSIYLPAAFNNPSFASERQGILAHELAHVRRCDAALNTCQLIVQMLFFFHPLVWWANSKTRQEREKCCDEVAISTLSLEPERYGSSIVEALMSANRGNRSRPLPRCLTSGLVPAAPLPLAVYEAKSTQSCTDQRQVHVPALSH